VEPVEKPSLKLPIFIMFAPIISLVVAMFLYAAVNFIFTTVESAGDTGSTSIATGANAADAYGDTPLFKTIANVILFLMGAGGVLAIVPCLVVGGVMIHKRRSGSSQESLAAQPARTWKDIE
jgi:hypothetical protein